MKDAFGRGYSRKRSECGARARNDTVRSRAALGIMLTGTRTGPGGAFPGLGQAGAGNARLGTRGLRPPVGGDRTGSNVPPRPRKPGLELRPRGESPNGKSRGGTPTGERAALKRAPHADACGGWNTRLPAFRFLYLPDASLNERHSELDWETFGTARLGLFRLLVPWRGGWQNSGAERVAGTTLLVRPRDSGGGGPCEAWWRGRGRIGTS